MNCTLYICCPSEILVLQLIDAKPARCLVNGSSVFWCLKIV